MAFLNDRQWFVIEGILQAERDPRGRKPLVSDRTVVEAVFYVLREGCRWRALPAEFGSWMRVFMRYTRWVESGLWWKILMRLQHAKALKVELVMMDGTNIRAHRVAAGARIKRGLRR